MTTGLCVCVCVCVLACAARCVDSAICCGFGVKARAGRKKLVRRGGREFFMARKRFAARIPSQSPVTLRHHRAGLVVGQISVGTLHTPGATALVRNKFLDITT